MQEVESMSANNIFFIVESFWCEAKNFWAGELTTNYAGINRYFKFQRITKLMNL